MRKAGHKLRMEEVRYAHKILDGKHEEKRNHSEDLGVDGKIILDLKLGKDCLKVWTGFIWLKIGIRVWFF